jgi:hypothetical protein
VGELTCPLPDPQQGTQPPLQVVRLALRLPDVRRVAGGLMCSDAGAPLMHEAPRFANLAVQGSDHEISASASGVRRVANARNAGSFEAS